MYVVKRTRAPVRLTSMVDRSLRLRSRIVHGITGTCTYIEKGYSAQSTNSVVSSWITTYGKGSSPFALEEVT